MSSLSNTHSAVSAQTYLAIELAGGGGSAEAAAAVTQLPFRLDDCQLGLGATVAVRRAQRHRRDPTEEGEGGWVKGYERKGECGNSGGRRGEVIDI